ncbi:MAG: DNA-3-methyladenine glycosylase 2 family protein [Actinobacteria bacterium]|nr:DNA-3-methyladenine glycosylase 2 family protein [Actinomycetota bacterium]
MSTPTAELRWQPPAPVDLVRTLRPLCHGTGDPTARFVDGVFWWAARTPAGPGTLALSHAGGDVLARAESDGRASKDVLARVESDGRASKDVLARAESDGRASKDVLARVESDGRASKDVLARAWGPGAEWLLEAVPGLLGDGDDWSALDVSGHRVLHEVRRQRPNVRLTRTGLVLHSLVPACLEQRVTGQEAFRAWRLLTKAYGEPAPGPIELWLPAEPARLLAVPSWDWHRFGVDAKRQRAIRAVATVADRLEECVEIARTSGFAAARQRLSLVPGVGPWTVAETTVRALGDPDAVSVGDFHLSNVVGYALTGAARTDDATMLELLAPWAGQRARVVKLILLSGLTPPKYGPKFSPMDMSRI